MGRHRGARVNIGETNYRKIIDDVPVEVLTGERERSDLIVNFKRTKEIDSITCKI